MIKAIIFDCFGVLITDVLEHIMQQRRFDAEQQEQVARLVTKSNTGEITPETFVTLIAEKLGMSAKELADQVRHGEFKNELLLSYISGLKPRFKMGLLSNVGSMQSLNSRFAEGELAKYFDVVVASGQIGFAKPEAQAYEITADMLGVRLTECIMIDDREDYCQGARGVGMQIILYRNFDQMKSELEKIIGGA